MVARLDSTGGARGLPTVPPPVVEKEYAAPTWSDIYEAGGGSYGLLTGTWRHFKESFSLPSTFVHPAIGNLGIESLSNVAEWAMPNRVYTDLIVSAGIGMVIPLRVMRQFAGTVNALALFNPVMFSKALGVLGAILVLRGVAPFYGYLLFRNQMMGAINQTAEDFEQISYAAAHPDAENPYEAGKPHIAALHVLQADDLCRYLYSRKEVGRQAVDVAIERVVVAYTDAERKESQNISPSLRVLAVSASAALRLHNGLPVAERQVSVLENESVLAFLQALGAYEFYIEDQRLVSAEGKEKGLFIPWTLPEDIKRSMARDLVQDRIPGLAILSGWAFATGGVQIAAGHFRQKTFISFLERYWLGRGILRTARFVDKWVANPLTQILKFIVGSPFRIYRWVFPKPIRATIRINLLPPPPPSRVQRARRVVLKAIRWIRELAKPRIEALTKERSLIKFVRQPWHRLMFRAGLGAEAFDVLLLARPLWCRVPVQGVLLGASLVAGCAAGVWFTHRVLDPGVQLMTDGKYTGIGNWMYKRAYIPLSRLASYQGPHQSYVYPLARAVKDAMDWVGQLLQ